MRSDRQLLLVALTTFVAAQAPGSNNNDNNDDVVDLDSLDLGGDLDLNDLDLDDLDLDDLDLGDIDTDPEGLDTDDLFDDLDVSENCASAMSEIMPRLTDLPIPNMGVIMALAKQAGDATQGCELPQITGSAAEDYTSYVEDLMSYHSKNKDTFESVADACSDDVPESLQGQMACTELKWADSSATATSAPIEQSTTATATETDSSVSTPTVTGGSGGDRDNVGENNSDSTGGDNDKNEDDDSDEAEADGGDSSDNESAASRVTVMAFSAIAAVFGLGAAALL